MHISKLQLPYVPSICIKTTHCDGRPFLCTTQERATIMLE